VVIDFVAGRLPVGGNALMVQQLKSGHHLSVINRMELLGFQDVPATIQEFADTARIYPLDDEVEAKTIALRKLYRLKLPDAIIAATAMVHDLKLLTRNTKDFDGIDGLQVVNPHTL
jgi:toxin FitB